jgi:hypothetical protein
MNAQQLLELRQQARRAFDGNLRQLLKTHPGQWVAYHGDRQVICAAHTHDLYQECFRQGLAPDEFVIFAIVPADEEITFGPMAFD